MSKIGEIIEFLFVGFWVIVLLWLMVFLVIVMVSTVTGSYVG